MISQAAPTHDPGLKASRSISVIFPAFNEQQNLPRTVNKACAVLDKIAERWEVLIVNDGSNDETDRVCDELARAYTHVFAFHHPSNRGYGAALKTGVTEASCDLIFFTDSDGQFDLEELEHLVAWSQEYDIVAGYRRKRRDPFIRLVNAWGWNTLVRLCLRVPVRDVDCAFKLFRRGVFRQIQIRAVGAMVNTEILAQASRFGMRIREVEVTHYPRTCGRATGARLRVIAKAFCELFQMWRRLHLTPKTQLGLYVHHEPVANSTPDVNSGTLSE